MGVRDIYRNRGSLGSLPLLKGVDRGLYFGRDTDTSLLTNLVAYYRLGDLQSAYGNYPLTNLGTVTFDAGKVGNAANMGASNSTKALYRLGSFPAIASSTTNQSYSLWFKVNTLMTAQKILLGHVMTRGMTAIAVSKVAEDYKLIFMRYICSGTDAYEEVNTTFAEDTVSWFHAVMTYDGTHLKGYLNGSNTGEIDSGGGYQQPGGAYVNSFVLGASPDTPYTEDGVPVSSWFSGLIDEVGVWNKVLSANEIADLYNNGLGNPLLGSPLP